MISVKEIREKITDYKEELVKHKKQIALGFIFALSLLFSFGFGYITAEKQPIAPIVINKCN